MIADAVREENGNFKEMSKQDEDTDESQRQYLKVQRVVSGCLQTGGRIPSLQDSPEVTPVLLRIFNRSFTHHSRHHQFRNTTSFIYPFPQNNKRFQNR